MVQFLIFNPIAALITLKQLKKHNKEQELIKVQKLKMNVRGRLRLQGRYQVMTHGPKLVRERLIDIRDDLSDEDSDNINTKA
jgi:hypothetical protein